ncbi:lipopolysaccharide biosynthesis protein [Baekduia sp. Peel2402]|uniref:lipopolysaccharide biosynthesis protein n=1 Tax=Baekduia sp. Peel2402 TaxID=3458296 RepID=UPI00403EB306
MAESNRPLTSAAVFAVAAAAQRALSLLLLPLYTRALTPAEYGDLSVILSFTTAAVIFLALGLDFALWRTYFGLENDPYRQMNLVWSAWVTTIISALVGTLLLSLGAVLFLRGSRIEPIDAILGIASSGMLVISTTVPMTVLRAEQRLRDFLVLTAMSALLTASFTVCAVVLLHWGIKGWLAAALAANALGTLAAAAVVPFRRPDPMDWTGVRASLRLGVPLMPHFVSHWALQLADRLALTSLVSASLVGVYSLTANLSLPALIAVQSLNQGFMPMYARAAHRTDERAGLASIATKQLLLTSSVCLLCAIVLPSVVTVVAPSEYSSAASILPWLVLGYAFVGAYSIPMNGLSLVLGRTSFVWVTTALSAMLNLALIYIFVPDHGLVAAAIASAVAYFALLVGMTLYARRHHSPVRLDLRTAVPGLAALGLIYAVVALLVPERGWTALLIRGGISAACVAAVGIAFLARQRRRRRAASPAVDAIN